eukprot:NODE_3312_length_991_cov_18.399306_g3166_i0.p1 GENE.NODE_3312_length_991_cov_18.399306_g3166_i0~~NODE_3312_length_991_cov_18.399306_g3166_i0.p1  ORF type:complete len:296 (+),score=57.15 NODE_3312_length_991_cov_18.399306_g3166_i0:83-970(+)
MDFSVDDLESIVPELFIILQQASAPHSVFARQWVLDSVQQHDWRPLRQFSELVRGFGDFVQPAHIPLLEMIAQCIEMLVAIVSTGFDLFLPLALSVLSILANLYLKHWPFSPPTFCAALVAAKHSLSVLLDRITEMGPPSSEATAAPSSDLICEGVCLVMYVVDCEEENVAREAAAVCCLLYGLHNDPILLEMLLMHTKAPVFARNLIHLLNRGTYVPLQPLLTMLADVLARPVCQGVLFPRDVGVLSEILVRLIVDTGESDSRPLRQVLRTVAESSLFKESTFPPPDQSLYLCD